MARISLALAVALGLVVSVVSADPAPAQEHPDGSINEFVANHDATDDCEFVEIFGPAEADLSGLTVLQVEGDDNAPGTVDTVLTVGTTGAGGYWVSSFLNNEFENGTITLLLVQGFVGSDGQDLDTDDDGVFDETPWTSIVDSVAVSDGGAGDKTYSETVLTAATPPAGSFPPGGASRIPDGTDTNAAADWVRNDFDSPCTSGSPADGEAVNTPGTTNRVFEAPPPPPPGESTDLKINEVDYDQPGTDFAEFVEIYNGGAEAVDLGGFELRLVNGTGGGASVYQTIPLLGTLAAGEWFVVCADDSTTPNCDLDVSPDSNLIQNGPPDAVAIAEAGGGAVVDSLSYEGDTGAPYTEGTGVGVEDDSGAVFAGLARSPDGADSDDNSADFTLVCITPGAANTTAGTDCTDPNPPPPGDPYTDLTIPEIQGPSHVSPQIGEEVRTTGVVTAVDFAGFYLQDVVGDAGAGSEATSNAIFVSSFRPAVDIGDQVTVEGNVLEFIPGGASTRNLPTTEIDADSFTVNSSGNPLPTPVVIGEGGRLPPAEVIEDDEFGSFDHEADGIDFYESMEAMLVTVKSPTTVAGTNFFGELYVIPRGVTPTQMSQRGTMNISPTDFNPERIQIDPDFDVSPTGFAPFVDTGAELTDVTGVIGYAFGNFEVIPTEMFEVAVESALAREATSLTPRGTRLTMASYNVLNLDPNDDEVDDEERDTDVADGRFRTIANQITHNLGSPDIVALQEIQDNSGADNDGVTAANETLQLLVDEIVAAGGPSYEFIDNPFIGNNTSGGQPGGNIRVAYLYNPERVTPLGQPETVVDHEDQQVNPENPFWDTRLPLVQRFDFKNRQFALVNNHFASKSGSAPLYGTAQNSTERQEDPTVNGSLDERRDQAEAVMDYLEPLLDEGSQVVVLGDLNEFEFISPLDEILAGPLENLTLRLDPDERYSYVFDGNSQSLDHILISENLSRWTSFDAVHVNAEFAATFGQASDHDPLVAAIDVARIAPEQSNRPGSGRGGPPPGRGPR